MDETNQKLKYPRDYHCKVIGWGKDGVRKAVEKIVGKREYQLNFSKYSSGGKYVSMKLSVRVESERIRDDLHKSLNRHDNVKLVI